MADGKQKFPVNFTVIVFASVFIVWVLVVVSNTVMRPDSYVSTVRLAIQPAAATDAGFLKAEAQVILSKNVLTEVVKQLNLNDVWGRRYFNGERLKTEESLQILVGRLGVSPIRNTTLIGINSYNDDPNEAAIVANSVAEVYQNFKNGNHQLAGAGGQVEIVDRAQPPLRPFKPNRPLWLIIAVVSGIFCGAVVAFLAVLARPFVKRLFASSKQISSNDCISHQQSVKQKY